ncbi:MAG TPA: pyruvate kinase [Planctomycetota bacterium]
MLTRFLPDTLAALQRGIGELRAVAKAQERVHAEWIGRVPEPWRPSARNLLHYLGVRGQELRPLQRELARLGLSSLGRMEGNVLDTLDAVLSALSALGGGSPLSPTDCALVPDFEGGKRLLQEHTRALLGPPPLGRAVRIMVTLGAEAAANPAVVQRLVDAGMDVARINLAHDHEAVWSRLAENVRAAARAAQRPCRVQVDFAGPKLRTGPMAPGPVVVRVRPRRDEVGAVTAPARIWLCAHACGPAPADAVSLPVPAALLAEAREGDVLCGPDLRGRRRSWRVGAAAGGGRLAEGDRTAYLGPGLELRLRRGGKTVARGLVGELPPLPGCLRLHAGDEFLLTRDLTPGRPATGERLGCIPCLLPEVFERVRLQDPIWFDDGHLGGRVVGMSDRELRILVTEAPADGFRLRAEKGINLPQTDLDLPALTPRDRACLDWACAHADLLGLSFAGRTEDVADLHAELVARRAEHLGVVLKIETLRAFERLPALLLAGLCSPPLGVMVARGDLGVEVGFARLAEVQEEILWLCEAAHVPVIWATQVLETMARTGQPSRAEVTDAAMGVRAECVMLNKGPFAAEAVRFLSSVLERMQAHHDKKRSMMRLLRVARGVDGGAAEPEPDRFPGLA